MKCPECKQEIDEVFVVSECTQKANLEEKRIVDYKDADVGDTIRVECGNIDCMADITEFLKSEGVEVS